MALIYHPDKAVHSDQTVNEEANKKIWLKIQKAYDTLVDEPKRKKYDSSLPFDDKIPKKSDFDDETFYEVFAPVFQRNAIFAKKKPVPNIGDKDTKMKQVDRFYNYWFDF